MRLIRVSTRQRGFSAVALSGELSQNDRNQALQALREKNHANGVLLSRRRREVGWALRHLGRVESTGVYDARGQSGARPQARCLGVG